MAGPTPIRGMLGWVAFDFAAIPCFGIINIFVFAPHFATAIVGDPVRGQSLWGFGQAIAGTLIALTAPLVGAATDKLGPRKPLFALFGMLALLALVQLGIAAARPDRSLAAILTCVILFSICIEFMVVVHNAMLPALVPERTLGRWSGWSFAIGYFATVAALAAIAAAPSTLSLPGAMPLPRELASGPFMALWMAVCLIPFFVWTPDRPANGRPAFRAIGEGVGDLKRTFGSACIYGNIWRYMLARAVFYDGLLALFLFSGIFAAGLHGWKTAQLATLGIAEFLMSALGALLLSPLDDRIGSKNMLLLSVSAVGIGTAAMLLLSQGGPGEALLTGIAPVAPLSLLGFPTVAEQGYFMLTALTMFFVGPALASSRTMIARLAPREMMGQFFGLFSLLGRATSFAAPLLIGIVTSLSGSQRLGLSTILMFITLGLAMLLRVREERSAFIA